MVNPSPMPKASTMDSHVVFFDANASALPRIIQFTTIKGTKIPSAACSAGANACIERSIIVTNDASTTEDPYDPVDPDDVSVEIIDND